MGTSHPHIILASNSPRRLEILQAHGLQPEVVASFMDEEALTASLIHKLSPEELAEELARAKARDVYLQLNGQDRMTASGAVRGEAKHKTLILAADTIVYEKEAGILGKPANHSEAVSMLLTLRDALHQVMTGVALISMDSGQEQSFVDKTTVRFGDYSLAEIEEYIAAEPPFDKAGSYAIQGMWRKHVVHIEGDFENVIGLPFYRIQEFLTLDS